MTYHRLPTATKLTAISASVLLAGLAIAWQLWPKKTQAAHHTSFAPYNPGPDSIDL